MAIRIVFGAVALGREVVKWFKQDGDEEETHRWSRETRYGIICARCADETSTNTQISRRKGSRVSKCTLRQTL